MERLEKLIEAATAVIGTVSHIRTADGREVRHSRGTAVDGDFNVDVIPVDARTRPMKEHYRIVCYVKQDITIRPETPLWRWRRVSRVEMVAAMEREAAARPGPWG